jgi:hypothetical protein
VSEWIDVKQRMPTEREMVLVNLSRGMYWLSYWFQWECMERPLWSNMLREWGEVTHWMPLPAPPEATHED